MVAGDLGTWNIPISQVPATANNSPGNKGQILKDLLNAHPNIQRVSIDVKNEQYHVSTTASKYKEVYIWLERLLQDHAFPFGPKLRLLKFGNTPVYGSIFKDAMSAASDRYDPSSIKPPTPNAWRNRPPLDISYVATDAVFPPLPTQKQTLATTSTASTTLDEDTIQSAILSAIKKLEEQHHVEMTKMKLEFQEKLDAVEKKMVEIGTNVATQTYQALTGDGSPLATKQDQEYLKQEVSLIQTQLATIIKMFNTGQTLPQEEKKQPDSMPVSILQHTPPSNHDTASKRSKVYFTPVKMKPLDDLFTQDHSVSSTNSTPEEEMEGCEY